MRKRPFLLFSLVVGVLIGAIVGFIQSAQFANLLKRSLAKHLPADAGIDGDFTELSIKIFPPGLSIVKPRMEAKARNILNVPGGTKVVASSVELVFLPFQMLSGNIRVHQVTVVDGEVDLPLGMENDPTQKTSKHKGFHWNDLLEIRADAVGFRNTRLRISLEEPSLKIDVLAERASVEQWSSKNGLGYELDISLRDLRGQFPKEWKFPASIEHIAARARVNSMGVQLDEVSIHNHGMDLQAAGTVKGDILAPKALTADGEVNLRGQIASIAGVLGASLEVQRSLGGSVLFQGKVKGNLTRMLETLRAEGVLTAEDVRYQDWAFDRVTAEAAWNASPEGGELSLTRASLTAAERERVGGNQPARGGKVEVGPLKWRVGSRDEIRFGLKLDRAHLHWLAAAVLKDVYMLDLRLSGPIDGVFTPSRGSAPWNLRTDLDLKVPRFQLDNQRLGKTRPLHKVLDIADIRLNGGVLIDASGVRPAGLTVSNGAKSKFALSGQIGSKTGYDLYAEGPVNLQDVGQIAETDIRGEGTLKTHVHGPAVNVFIDFDADIKAAQYLKLQLGNLKGRITWEDDPMHLVFSGCTVQQGATRYHAAGLLDLSAENTVLMDVNFEKGRLHDVIEIFSEFEKGLWWFPRTLNGDVSGTAKLSGGLNMDQLRVDADLEGTNWDFMGERFDTVSLQGGYDRGKYHIASVKSLKHVGRIDGRIAFSADKKFDWALSTEDLQIRDIDMFARLDIPIRGRISVNSEGTGPESTLESKSTLTVDEVVVRGLAMPQTEATIKTSGGVAGVKGVFLGGQGNLDLSYSLHPGGASYIKGSMQRLDFSSILLLLNAKLIQDKSLAGYLSGNMDLAFKSGAAERANGRVELSEYLLAKTGSQFSLAQPVVIKPQEGTFDVDNLVLQGKLGETKVRLHAKDSNLTGSVTGELDSSIAEFFTSTISSLTGTARLDFNFGGKLREPAIEGVARLQGGTLRIPVLDSPFENLVGALKLRQNVITVDALNADLASGRVTSSGTIELFADRFPKINLNGNLLGPKVKVYPFQYAKLRGKVSVHGEELPYMIDGKVFVESALSKEKVMSQGKPQALRTANYQPPPTSRQESDYPRFKLNIEVNADSGILVQNDLFDAEMKANITLVNTLETPRVIGTAEWLQGKLTFKDRQFQIQSGSLKFDNPAVINPSFNLIATTELGGTRVQLYANGTMEKPKIDLTSNPVLPESEILSLLALGVTSDDVRKLRSADRSTLEQGEAASLLLHSLDFNRDVQDKTGFEIQLDEAVNTQAATSAFRPRSSDTESTAAPKIVIKRKLGKKVEFSVGSTVGVGTNSQREVNAEYKVTPAFSVLGVWDTLESVDRQDKTTSYGVDLKLQKRFK